MTMRREMMDVSGPDAIKQTLKNMDAVEGTDGTQLTAQDLVHMTMLSGIAAEAAQGFHNWLRGACDERGIKIEVTKKDVIPLPPKGHDN